MKAESEGGRRSGSESGRSLGAVTSGGDGSQGVVIEVDVDEAAVAALPGGEYTVSVYMVGNGTEAKQAIRVMDLESLEPVAHTPLIDGSATRTSASNTTGGQKEPNTESAKGFSEGVYFRLRYSRGVRLRIMSIDGSNTASAVFVDRKALE